MPDAPPGDPRAAERNPTNPPPPQDPPPAGGDDRGNANIHHLTTGSFKRIKQDAMEKGRKAAMQEFDDKAKKAGFDSYDAMIAFMGELRARNGNGNGGRSQEPRRNDRRDDRRNDRRPDNRGQDPDRDQPRDGRRAENRNWKELQRAQQQVEQERRAREREREQRRIAEQERDAKEAEMELLKSAYQAGIRRDPDYAVRLLTRHCEREFGHLEDADREKKLRAFDDRKFFDGLRESHPYLFDEQVVPANTGTAGGNGAVPGGQRPPAPKPAAVTKKVADDGKVDAMKMSPQEFDDLARGAGLNLNFAIPAP